MRHIIILIFFLILYLTRLSLHHPISDGPVIYRFILLDNPSQSGSHFRYSLSHTTIEWDHYPSISLGDYIEVSGKLSSFSQLGFITSSLLTADSTKLLPPRSLNLGENILISLSRLRSLLTSKLAHSLPEPESSLAAGILLGVKRDIGYDFKTSLIKSGTMHTVAASGYNVNLVARYIISATSFLPRPASLTIAVLGIVIFCILAGGSAAVVRAGVMGSLILIGTGLGRQKDGLRLLFIASYLMLMIDPLYLFDVGYQLSVAATFGILFLEPLLSAKLRLPIHFHSLNSILKDYFLPTIAATITTLPISYFTFGQFSLLGIVSNPLVLPIIPLIMALTTAFLSISWFLPTFSALISPILYLPLHYYVWIVKLFGSL